MDGHQDWAEYIFDTIQDSRKQYVGATATSEQVTDQKIVGMRLKGNLKNYNKFYIRYNE